jgi:hypothetical protein
MNLAMTMRVQLRGGGLKKFKASTLFKHNTALRENCKNFVKERRYLDLWGAISGLIV